jgi:hypothetical protein
MKQHQAIKQTKKVANSIQVFGLSKNSIQIIQFLKKNVNSFSLSVYGIPELKKDMPCVQMGKDEDEGTMIISSNQIAFLLIQTCPEPEEIKHLKVLKLSSNKVKLLSRPAKTIKPDWDRSMCPIYSSIHPWVSLVLNRSFIN